MDPIKSSEALVLQEQMRGVKEGVDDLKAAMITVNATLVKLVLVEQRQLEFSQALERMRTTTDKLDSRVVIVENAIKVDLPPLKQTRNWTIGVFILVVAFALWSILGSNISIRAPMQPAPTKTEPAQ